MVLQTSKYSHEYILSALEDLNFRAELIHQRFEDDISVLTATDIESYPPRLIVNRGYIRNKKLAAKADKIVEHRAEGQYGNLLGNIW